MTATTGTLPAARLGILARFGRNQLAVGTDRDPLDTCTAHVFDIHEDEQIMTIAYYMGGVRVLDLSGLADLPIGVGQGEEEIPGAIRRTG